MSSPAALLEPAFWARALDDTEGLRRPFVWPGAAPASLCTPDDLAEVLRRNQPARARVRAYAEGGRREDLRERMLRDPPGPSEPLATWMQRLTGGQRGGLVLNQIEAALAPLAGRVAVFLQPLLERIGMPCHGVSLGAFVGDYGFTPFGIHHDRTTWVLHAHMRGRKRMYLWSAAAYEAAWGSADVCHEPERLLDSAEYRFELEPGALFYFPGDHYHIGCCDELAVALAMILRGRARRDIMAELCTTLADEVLPPSVCDRPWVARELPDGLADDDVPVADWLAQRLQACRASLRSNGGLRLPPPPRTARADDDAVPWRRGPFALVGLRTRRGLEIHARRRCIPAPASAALERLLGRWNEGATLWDHEVVGARGESMDEHAARALLRELRATGALEPVPADEESDDGG